MRPVVQDDVIAAARALLAVEPSARRAVMQALIDDARRADAYRRCCGSVDPRRGDGTLLAAALLRAGKREAQYDLPEFLSCQVTVLRALLGRIGPTRPSRAA